MSPVHPNAIHIGRPSAGSRLAQALLVAGVLAYLLLSASNLAALGIPYDAPEGGQWAKLHPGTFLILAAAFVAAASRGNPLGVALQQLGRHPLLAVYVGCIVTLTVYAVARYGSGGAAFFIDTHIMAAVAALAVSLSTPAQRRSLALWMAVALLLNGALGVAEAATQWRLIPLRVNGEVMPPEEYFRASAFMGHPLANAMVTASLLPLVMCMPVAAGWRAAALLWLGLSLLAFGGRSSLALAVVGFGGYFTVLALRALLQGRLNYLQVVGGAIGLVLSAALMVAVVWASGLGERIFSSLTFDSSASVRVRIWSVLGYMSDVQHYFGATPEEVELLYHRMGLQPKFEAIENFWLLLYVQYGLAGFSFFLLGLGAALLHLWRQSSPAFRVALVIFVLGASTTNSLATKTPVFALLMVAVAATAAAPQRRARHLPGFLGPMAADAQALHPLAWPSRPGHPA